MDPNTLNIIKGAAGAAGADKVYVEDVFSTYVYEGDEQPDRLIPNGLDLHGEGGMVWIKCRENTYHYALFDTETGANERLRSDDLVEATTVSQYLTAFNSNGFTIGTDDDVNRTIDGDYVSWSFRKAPGFFDVVEYTGNGTSNGDTKTISHNLGSTPGFVIIRRTSANGGHWLCWHRSLNGTGTPAYDNRRYLELDSGVTTGSMGGDIWGTIDASEFQVKYNDTTGQDAYEINESGATYIAYFFAHDDQQFGDGGNESIIKCGSFTGAAHTESLGFEPQWLLAKRTNGVGNWYLVDNMRGFSAPGQDAKNLRPNLDIAENTGPFHITSDGFYYSSSALDYIYVAIRRGPMKTPEDATKVFNFSYGLNASADGKVFNTSFPVDLSIGKRTNGATLWYVFDRLRGEGNYHHTNDKAIQGTIAYQDQLDHMDGVYTSTAHDYTSWIGYQFKRAPGFFDMVSWPGDSNSGREISHNLKAIPQMIIIKRYTGAEEDWAVGHEGITLGDGVIYLNGNWSESASPPAAWDNTAPTDSIITLGDWQGVNSSSDNGRYIAYLFASLDGISKVGSETVGSSAIDVNCGFTGGARFVMIKRTDAAGDWYVYDSTRGIAIGNDDFLLINEDDDEDQNDYIDPFTTGFKINSSLPAGEYIYLAIA